MSKVVKITPWNIIKAAYLEGVTPKQLAEKYGITAKSIREKASKEGWTNEKATISNNLQLNTQDRIKELTNIALDALAEVINDPECKNAEKISAAKAILDVSGLKSVKQELEVKDVPLIIDNID